MSEYDTYRTDEIVCPWCGESDRDSWECNDFGGKTIDCISCGKPMKLEVDFEVYYTTKKGTPNER